MQVQQTVEREDLGGSAEAENLPRTMVEQGDDTVDIRLGNGAEVELFRVVLAQKAVGVFVSTSLPGRVRISKVNGGLKRLFDATVTKELVAMVDGEGAQ